MNYPIVLISQTIKDIIANPNGCNYLGNLPQKPLEPVEPTIPKRESFDGDKNLDKTLAIIYLIIFSFIAFINRESPSLIILIIVLAVISYLVTLSLIKGNPSKEYERALLNYKSRTKIYQESKERYDYLFDNYQRKLKEIDGFNHLKNKNASQKELSKYLLSIYFSKCSEFSDDSDVKKGVSELTFYSHLTKYFPGKIFHNKNLDMLDYSYHPDFVYFDKNAGILIDIEVDEPYSLDNQEIIHTIGNDEERNNCFINSNWVVLRFAEEQVIKQPVECCKIIENTINFLNMELEENEIINNVNIRQIGAWTTLEAEKMKNENYREKYLNNK
jgi:hypothetical protein